VLLGLVLDPLRNLAGQRSLALGAERLVLVLQLLGNDVVLAIPSAGLGYRRQRPEPFVAAVEALALLPAVNLAAPGIVRIGLGEVIVGRSGGRRARAAPAQAQQQHQDRQSRVP